MGVCITEFVVQLWLFSLTGVNIVNLQLNLTINAISLNVSLATITKLPFIRCNKMYKTTVASKKLRYDIWSISCRYRIETETVISTHPY